MAEVAKSAAKLEHFVSHDEMLPGEDRGRIRWRWCAAAAHNTRYPHQYMLVERDVANQTRRMTMEGTSQPASANMFGSCGTPGPVMLLINSAIPANMPMFLPPKPALFASIFFFLRASAPTASFELRNGDGPLLIDIWTNARSAAVMDVSMTAATSSSAQRRSNRSLTTPIVACVPEGTYR